MKRAAVITINFARTDFGLIAQVRQWLIAGIVLLLRIRAQLRNSASGTLPPRQRSCVRHWKNGSSW